MIYFFGIAAAIGYLATVAVLRRDINKLNRVISRLERKYEHFDLRADILEERQRSEFSYLANSVQGIRERAFDNSKLLKKYTSKRVQSRKRNRNRNLELTDGPS